MRRNLPLPVGPAGRRFIFFVFKKIRMTKVNELIFTLTEYLYLIVIFRVLRSGSKIFVDRTHACRPNPTECVYGKTLDYV